MGSLLMWQRELFPGDDAPRRGFHKHPISLSDGPALQGSQFEGDRGYDTTNIVVWWKDRLKRLAAKGNNGGGRRAPGLQTR